MSVYLGPPGCYFDLLAMTMIKQTAPGIGLSPGHLVQKASHRPFLAMKTLHDGRPDWLLDNKNLGKFHAQCFLIASRFRKYPAWREVPLRSFVVCHARHRKMSEALPTINAAIESPSFNSNRSSCSRNGGWSIHSIFTSYAFAS